FWSCHDAAPPALSTLSLHDALPILLISRIGCNKQLPAGLTQDGTCRRAIDPAGPQRCIQPCQPLPETVSQSSGYHLTPIRRVRTDRKSTRLNSSHVKSSYAVFCLQK